jgi:hypothetical protein
MIYLKIFGFILFLWWLKLMQFKDECPNNSTDAVSKETMCKEYCTQEEFVGIEHTNCVTSCKKPMFEKIVHTIMIFAILWLIYKLISYLIKQLKK